MAGTIFEPGFTHDGVPTFSNSSSKTDDYNSQSTVLSASSTKTMSDQTTNRPSNNAFGTLCKVSVAITFAIILL
jgi:hypothetical protein